MLQKYAQTPERQGVYCINGIDAISILVLDRLCLDELLLQTATKNYQAAPLEKPKLADLLGRGFLAKAPPAPASDPITDKYLFIFSFFRRKRPPFAAISAHRESQKCT